MGEKNPNLLSKRIINEGDDSAPESENFSDISFGDQEVNPPKEENKLFSKIPDMGKYISPIETPGNTVPKKIESQGSEKDFINLFNKSGSKNGERNILGDIGGGNNKIENEEYFKELLARGLTHEQILSKFAELNNTEQKAADHKRNKSQIETGKYNTIKKLEKQNKNRTRSDIINLVGRHKSHDDRSVLSSTRSIQSKMVNKMILGNIKVPNSQIVDALLNPNHVKKFLQKSRATSTQKMTNKTDNRISYRMDSYKRTRSQKRMELRVEDETRQMKDCTFEPQLYPSVLNDSNYRTAEEFYEYQLKYVQSTKTKLDHIKNQKGEEFKEVHNFSPKLCDKSRNIIKNKSNSEMESTFDRLSNLRTKQKHYQPIEKIIQPRMRSSERKKEQERAIRGSSNLYWDALRRHKKSEELSVKRSRPEKMRRQSLSKQTQTFLSHGLIKDLERMNVGEDRRVEYSELREILSNLGFMRVPNILSEEIYLEEIWGVLQGTENGINMRNLKVVLLAISGIYLSFMCPMGEEEDTQTTILQTPNPKSGEHIGIKNFTPSTYLTDTTSKLMQDSITGKQISYDLSKIGTFLEGNFYLIQRDAQRLRIHFKPLYHNRKETETRKLQSLREAKTQSKQSQWKPKIEIQKLDPISIDLARKFRQKICDKDMNKRNVNHKNSKTMSHYDWQMLKKTQEIECSTELATRREKHKVKCCTFRPKINSPKKYRNISGAQTSRNCHPVSKERGLFNNNKPEKEPLSVPYKEKGGLRPNSTKEINGNIKMDIKQESKNDTKRGHSTNRLMKKNFPPIYSNLVNIKQTEKTKLFSTPIQKGNPDIYLTPRLDIFEARESSKTKASNREPTDSEKKSIDLKLLLVLDINVSSQIKHLKIYEGKDIFKTINQFSDKFNIPSKARKNIQRIVNKKILETQQIV